MPEDIAPFFEGEDKRPGCREDIAHWIAVYSQLVGFARRHPVRSADRIEARLRLWQQRQLLSGSWQGLVSEPPRQWGARFRA